jgi:ribonuclease HIII
MDLTKFHESNISKLTDSDLMEFKQLSNEQINELASLEKNFVPYIVYKNLSNKFNTLETLGNFTSVNKLIKQGNTIELVTPRHFYKRGATFATIPKKVEEVVIEKSISIEEFAALKGSEKVIEVPNEVEKATVIIKKPKNKK